MRLRLARRRQPAAPSGFADRPRLLLTPTKLSDLSAKRVANTTEYAAVKTYADTYTPAAAAIETTLAAELGTGGVGTTFDVADGSAFAEGASKVLIDLEVISVTRSGNTFTVVSRGDEWGDGSGATPIEVHPAGASVWVFSTAGTDLVGTTPSVALLIQAGETGYTTKARWSYAVYMSFWSRSALYTGDNAIRWNGWGLALAYDWLYDVLTARERTRYADLLKLTAQDVIDNPKLADTGQQSLREAVAGNNVANGQIRSALAMAATTYGHNSSAQTQWDALVAKIDDSIRPGMLGGGISAGPVAEGIEYGMTTWWQLVDIFRVLASALGDDTKLTAIAPWLRRLAEYHCYSTTPGVSNSATTTTGTIAPGGTELTVASATSFAVGQEISVVVDAGSGTNMVVDASVNTDVAPDGWSVTAADVGRKLTVTGNGAEWGPQGITQTFRVDSVVSGKWRLSRSPAAVGSTGGVWAFYRNNASYQSMIAGVSGNVLTLSGPFPGSATAKTVSHVPCLFTFGDVEGKQNYERMPTYGLGGGDMENSVASAQDALGAADTHARYLEHWLDTAAFLPVVSAVRWVWLLYRDTGVTPLDYTAALPVNYTTADPDAFGVVIGRSAWAADATFMTFLSAHHCFDHSTSYWNNYTFQRKGVPLTSHLVAYFGQGTRGPYYDVPTGSGFMELPYLGSRWHNAIHMNGHSGINPGVGTSGEPGTLARSAVTTTYAYGRGDASGPYSEPTVNGVEVSWASLGYANDDALTWVRDAWMFPTADLQFVHDRTTYANATTSPTTWFQNTPGQPSNSSGRLTMTQSGQKLVTDVVLPASASITIVDLVGDDNEDEGLEGWRTEWNSGVSASEEYGLIVLQGMDSGDTPAAVSLLTTTNANVVQVGTSHVVGFAKGATPTLPITYDYTGTPGHYLAGFAPSTAYHVTNSAGTVTVDTATGSGDTTATAAGLLVF